MPKSWVEKNKLKRGDIINVDEGSADLVLSPNALTEGKKSKEITIEVDDKSLDLIKAEIVSAYLNNYDAIDVMGKELEKHIIKVKEIVRSLTGLEIMEQTSTRLVAKDLIDINDISIQNIIRRMDMITRAMIDDAILCLDGKCGYQSIEHRDADVNRLYYLGFRTIKNAMGNPMIAKKLGMSNWELHSSKMVLSRIEEIADRQKRICRFLSQVDFDDKTLKELKDIYRNFGDSYLEVMKAYYTNDRDMAYKIEITNKDRILACEKFLEKCACEGHGKKAGLYCQCVPTAKAMEYLKAMSTFIKHISRIVISLD
ncbi:phosphate uptake regulator PhoU [Candidatus Woesearchaeota archaeon]|nr:phosphate uptake regulator PhoU [Candidatus Woesearchaeota archaeon]